MASDYTIIMWVRHRFGSPSDDGAAADPDSNAPFVGVAGEFAFSCPHIDRLQGAVLQFAQRRVQQVIDWPDPKGDQYLVGVSNEFPVKINGQLLAGGVSMTPSAPNVDNLPMWTTRTLLVDAGVLAEENILRIESSVQFNEDVDGTPAVFQGSFTIDNAVIYYKTGGPTKPVSGTAV